MTRALVVLLLTLFSVFSVSAQEKPGTPVSSADVATPPIAEKPAAAASSPQAGSGVASQPGPRRLTDAELKNLRGEYVLHGSAGSYKYRFLPGGDFNAWYSKIPDYAFPTTLAQTGSLRGTWGEVRDNTVCLKVQGRFANRVELREKSKDPPIYDMVKVSDC